MSVPSAYRGSVHRFQRQADGSEPGTFTRDRRRNEREDRIRWSERSRGLLVDRGIKNIFPLIRNLQDADGQET